MAHQRFQLWRCPAAYACAHLAFHVARRYDHFSSAKQLPILLKAVYYARHAYNPDVVPDLLIKPPNGSDDVGLLQLVQEDGALEDPRHVYAVVQELGALCNESGDIELAHEARELMERADRSFKTNKGIDAEARANFLRRDAHIRTSDPKDIRAVPRLLAESVELNRDAKVNINMTGAFRMIALRDKKVREILDQDLLPTLGGALKSRTLIPLRMTAGAAIGISFLGGLLNADRPRRADVFFSYSRFLLDWSRHRLPQHYPGFWTDAINLLAPHVSSEKVIPFQSLIRPALPDGIASKIRGALEGVLRKRILGAR